MLKTIEVPTAITRTLDRSLSGYLCPGDPSPARLGKPQPAQKVFSLGLDALAGGATPAARATFVNWRFLINGSGGDGVYATVAPVDGGAPELTDVSRGHRAAVVLQSNRDVNKLAAVKEHDYSLCTLAIPGLLTECFWLRWLPENPNQDLIVPFITALRELMPMHPYTIEQFSEITQPLAKKKLEAMDRLKAEEIGRANERLAAARKRRAEWQRRGAPYVS